MASKQQKNDEPGNKDAQEQPKTPETVKDDKQPPVELPPIEQATVVTDATDLLGEQPAVTITATATAPASPLQFVPPDEHKLPPLQSQLPVSVPEDLSAPANETATASGWTCPKCPDKTYDYRSHLLRHIKRVHPGEASAMEAALPAASSPGRKMGSKNASKADFSDLSSTIAESATTDYKLMAEMMFDITTATAANALGPEWLPRPDNPDIPQAGSKERDNFVVVLQAYLKSRQMKDIPPGMMLTIVALAYSAPRLRAPATSSKIKAMFYFVKSKFARSSRLQVK